MFEQASLEKINTCSQFIIPQFISSTSYVPIGLNGPSRCWTFSLRAVKRFRLPLHCDTPVGILTHRGSSHGSRDVALALPTWSAGAPGGRPTVWDCTPWGQLSHFPKPPTLTPELEKGPNTDSLPELASKSAFDQTLSQNQGIHIFT